jgi:hypothetical protein
MFLANGDTRPAEVSLDDLDSLPFKPPDFSRRPSKARSTGLPSRACSITGVLKPRWVAMAEGRISESYQKMSVEDQIEFNRWLKANAVVASIFAAAVVAMAFVGAQSSGSADRPAAGTRTTLRSEFLASDRTNWGKVHRRVREARKRPTPND